MLNYGIFHDKYYNQSQHTSKWYILKVCSEWFFIFLNQQDRVSEI